MNSREMFFGLLDGQITNIVPAAPHWWGLYKFQLAGIASGYKDEAECLSLGGSRLAEIDSLFYETYKPDWFHLGCGAYSIEKNRKAEIETLKHNVRKLSSRADIDEYVRLAYLTSEEIEASGMYEHVRILSQKYGKEVFIALNEGNPICGILDPHGTIGFEEGLIGLMEKPEMMEYLIFREYEAMLEKIKVLKKYGCHAYIGSETYCTPDIISPVTYRKLIFPAQKYFYENVRNLGLVPITYFLGDILPLVEDIGQLGADALMIEESKKTFVLDIVEIRKKLSSDVVLFGNLDSVYTLLNGTVEDVKNETLKQLEAAKYGRFIMANGCPIAFDTPEENIQAMIKTAHEFKEEIK